METTPVKTARQLEAELLELRERLENAEATIADWGPFVNQMRMTLAQLAMNPMVAAMIPPQYRSTLAQYAAPTE